jgi:hypothetical protein
MKSSLSRGDFLQSDKDLPIAKRARRSYDEEPLEWTGFQLIVDVLFPFSFDADEDNTNFITKIQAHFSELVEIAHLKLAPKDLSRSIVKFASK